MAAFEDFPWIDSMAPTSYTPDHGLQLDSQPPTVAAFSPSTISGSSLASKQRSSIIVHRKSPLLVATPPAVTRALAYSHPFILPLNKLAGLLTWSSGDPWQSFLFVASFWAVVLYSDVIILWAGPILLVIALILGMYWRRYSPLSSSALTSENHGHVRTDSESSMRHHKSLDEIVETMRSFTTRCNILLEPLLDLTDFLSTQRTATSATTRPALTALFVRILLVTPIWVLLSAPPLYIITTRRVVMTLGTLFLTYHSRPARVSRVIVWRSLAVRRICSMITGLSFSLEKDRLRSAESRSRTKNIAATRHGNPSGVRFTFAIYENQRRWLGIGWTYSMFPSERSVWTDEHLNTVSPRDEFELPDVHGGNAEWRWVKGSEWRIEGADDPSSKADSTLDGGGWIYYDNKWNDGRRGQDGWDRYTRRRKWYRDAELVEIGSSSKESQSGLTQALQDQPTNTGATTDADPKGGKSKSRRRRWFSSSKNGSEKTPPASSRSSVDINRDSPSGQNATRPVNIQHSRNSSNYSGKTSHNSSIGREGSLTGSGANSDSFSIRHKEAAHAQDHLDRWGSRAAGGTERAERELGLGDDVNMGLS